MSFTPPPNINSAKISKFCLKKQLLVKFRWERLRHKCAHQGDINLEALIRNTEYR